MPGVSSPTEKKRLPDAIFLVRVAPNVKESAEGCSRIVAPRGLVRETRTGTVLGHAGGERGVLRVSPGGGRLAGRRQGLGLLVVGLGLLRENIAAAARGLNELRQWGEATRGGRASGGATVARHGVPTAARARGSHARGATRADRVPRRTRRPAPPRIREGG